MQKLTVVTEQELKSVVEGNIANFILEQVDPKHFNEGQDIDFDLYDKERINKKLSKKKEKEVKRIALAAYVLYSMVLTMDIKIHRSAFTFIAYLKDIHLGNKELED